MQPQQHRFRLFANSAHCPFGTACTLAHNAGVHSHRIFTAAHPIVSAQAQPILSPPASVAAAGPAPIFSFLPGPPEESKKPVVNPPFGLTRSKPSEFPPLTEPADDKHEPAPPPLFGDKRALPSQLERKLTEFLLLEDIMALFWVSTATSKAVRGLLQGLTTLLFDTDQEGAVDLAICTKYSRSLRDVTVVGDRSTAGLSRILMQLMMNNRKTLRRIESSVRLDDFAALALQKCWPELEHFVAQGVWGDTLVELLPSHPKLAGQLMIRHQIVPQPIVLAADRLRSLELVEAFPELIRGLLDVNVTGLTNLVITMHNWHQQPVSVLGEWLAKLSQLRELSVVHDGDQLDASPEITSVRWTLPTVTALTVSPPGNTGFPQIEAPKLRELTVPRCKYDVQPLLVSLPSIQTLTVEIVDLYYQGRVSLDDSALVPALTSLSVPNSHHTDPIVRALIAKPRPPLRALSLVDVADFDVKAILDTHPQLERLSTMQFGHSDPRFPNLSEQPTGTLDVLALGSTSDTIFQVFSSLPDLTIDRFKHLKVLVLSGDPTTSIDTVVRACPALRQLYVKVPIGSWSASSPLSATKIDVVAGPLTSPLASDACGGFVAATANATELTFTIRPLSRDLEQPHLDFLAKYLASNPLAGYWSKLRKLCFAEARTYGTEAFPLISAKQCAALVSSLPSLRSVLIRAKGLEALFDWLRKNRRDLHVVHDQPW